jgi:hypothetical protein
MYNSLQSQQLTTLKIQDGSNDYFNEKRNSKVEVRDFYFYLAAI